MFEIADAPLLLYSRFVTLQREANGRVEFKLIGNEMDALRRWIADRAHRPDQRTMPGQAT